MPQQEPTMVPNTQRCVARALYDNVAESPDELAFRRGDVLTVLEQNTMGLEGWWLCSMRGRQGICPGNRLRLLAGVFDTSSPAASASPSASPSPAPPSGTPTATPEPREPVQGKRRSWHVQPNKVLTPQRFGDVFLYDMPPNRHSPLPDPLQGRYATPRNSTPSSMASMDSYDVPPRAVPTPTSTPTSTPVPACYDTPAPAPLRPALLRRESSESYDVPRPIGTRSPLSAVLLMQQRQLTPSSSASSLTADSMHSGHSAHSAPNSNRSSVASSVASSLASCGNEYDVPRRALAANTASRASTPQGMPSQTYDVPAAAFASAASRNVPQQAAVAPAPAPAPAPRELPLELGSALESLARLQGEATAAVSRLLGFAGPQWRHRERLEPCLMDIKLAVVRLRTALHDLTEFGDGALGNAAKASDKGLVLKLRPLIKALSDADRLVHDTTARLDALDWSLEALCRDEDDSGPARRVSPDALDQLVACAQALTEDVRQAASTIQGNSTLLFKRASSPNGSTHSGNGEWLEDYDYVNLESKESVAKQNAEILDDLPDKLRKSFDGLVRESETLAAAVPVEPEDTLDADDRRILSFYAGQIMTHSAHLTHAIDAFLQTVEHNQPPKVFLAHSKFVVLSAHWLVQVGDTVHRNVTCNEVRSRVLTCTNALSEALGSTVHKTKKAALHFPSVTAVQEMVDSIVDISHLARDLKLSMVQASQQL